MKKYAPFISGSLFLLLFVAVLEAIALYKTGGHFCYPLDDTFIHMSVAKNLSLYHIWGISPYEWVSTSSSPLYTCLLALSYVIAGVNIYSPFIISMAGGLLTVYALNKELGEHSTLTNAQKTACIIFTLIIAVIPSLSLSGMEHTLQIAFTLFFVHASATLLISDNRRDAPSVWSIAILGALMVCLRYENIFVVITVCALLLLRKKIGAAFLIGFISVLPVILFGAFFYTKGGFPIPNSVLIKGNTNFRSILGGQLSLPALSGSLGGILIVACIVAFERVRKSIYDRDFYLLVIFIVVTLFHSVFAQFGWFFRYEAYLIVLGVVHLSKMFLQGFHWADWKRPANIIIGCSVLILCSNLGLRVLNALYKTPGAIHNIYDQQYQMGKFIRKYYKGDAIAANDIGAISYFGDIRTIDLWGLANNEVTLARRHKYWTPTFLQRMVQKNNAKVVLIYDSWFDKKLSSDWFKVATWRLPYNVICGDDFVSFYATDKDSADTLEANLKQYAQEYLPRENIVEYFR